ncbi:hypothetical protein D3C81_1061510 [compost metagenome]
MRPEAGHHALHHTHQQATDQRTAERAHATNHHHHEGDAENFRADKRLGATQRGEQHPGDTRQANAEGKGQREQAEDIGAQQRDGFGALTASAYQGAEAGAFEQQPQAEPDQGGEADQEQAVVGVDEVAEDQHSTQLRWHGDVLADRPPDQHRGFLDDQGDAQRDENLERMRQVVDALDQQALHRPGQRCHCQWRDQQCEPEVAGDRHGGVAQVGAEQKERTVGEVDEVEQAENDRQADGDEEVDHPQPQAVEQLEQVQIEHECALDSTQSGCLYERLVRTPRLRPGRNRCGRPRRTNGPR